MALTKPGELVGWDWPAEIESLRLVTMVRLQKCQICSRLNALGNDAQVKASANVDDCVHDGRLAVVGIDPTNERPVDFEGIERELLKIAQAGVARAEVIDRHPYPSIPQNLEDGRRALGMFHKNSLGHLQLEIAWIQAGFAEDRKQAFQKLLVLKLDRGDIDGHGRYRQPCIHPGPLLRACFTKDPGADGQNQAGVFRYRNEPHRRDRAASGRPPADQRFGSGNRSSLEIDLRLVVEREFLSIQGAPQVLFDGLPLHGPVSY